MYRRSNRLQEAHYYTEQGSPSVSYKERLYKVFQRRAGYDKLNYKQQDHGDFISMTRNDTDSIASTSTPQTARTTTPQTQTVTADTQTTHTWTSGAEAVSAVTTGTQTTWPKRKQVKTKRGFSFHFGFPLLLLLAFAFTHMQLRAELEQEVRSLRQLFNTVSPPADNMPNFASKSQGARVVPSLSSETYWPQKMGIIMNSIFSWWYRCNRQIDVIQGHSNLHPAECWPFSGERGHLFITLSHPVSITHVTLGHITKSQSPNGFIASAPREFSVYGLQNTDEEGTFLGKLVYDQDGAAFQTFQLTNPDKGVFRHVKLQIENNWGNKDYTCLYSFRVHGNLAP